MAYLDQPVGERMEEEPPDELGRLQGHDLLPVPVGIVLPREGDVAVLRADNAAARDGDPVGVPAEIGKHSLRSVEGGFCIDHPLFRVKPIQEGRERLPEMGVAGELQPFFVVGLLGSM